MNCMDKKCEWGKAPNSPDGNIILCDEHVRTLDEYAYFEELEKLETKYNK